MNAEMQTTKDYSAVAKGLLKCELKRRNMTYAHLVEALAQIGVIEDEKVLRNRVARGNFSAAFFLRCLIAIGCEKVHLD